MSCICYICKNSGQVESHEGYVESDFTVKNCVGNLYIQGYTSSADSTYLGFRLNRCMCIIPADITVVLPTWTIEDCLFIEIHSENKYIGLGKLFLSKSRLSGTEELKDIEWYTDIVTEISIDINYKPVTITQINAVSIYRKTILIESEKIELTVKIAGVEYQHKIRDSSLGFKQEIWQLLGTCDKSTEAECILKSTEKRTSLVLPSCIQFPAHCNIPTPEFEGNFVNIYVIPFFSWFIESSSNTVLIQLPSSTNIWLGSLQPSTVLNLSLVSSISSESVDNETEVSVNDITDIFEYEFVSFTSEDKIVIKCLEDNKLISVGILKLKEIPGLEAGKPFETSAQIGYNSCQFWITVNPRERDKAEVRVSGHAKYIDIPPEKLTFKDPIFLDVLELLEYKINRIKQKNSLVTTQVNKVQSKNETLKKKISELERAPSIADYKTPLAKSKPKTESIKKEVYEGICGCGRPNPKFKGYCEECVKNVKAEYERVFNWFNPIETKHKSLEDRYMNINTRKILLESKVKKLEDKISKPINIEYDSGIESAAETAANLRRLEEEIKNLEEESENTADLYAKQQQEYQAELEKRKAEQEKQKKYIEEFDKHIADIEKNVAETSDKLVFKQYFNEKYGNKKK